MIFKNVLFNIYVLKPEVWFSTFMYKEKECCSLYDLVWVLQTYSWDAGK